MTYEAESQGRAIHRYVAFGLTAQEQRNSLSSNSVHK